MKCTNCNNKISLLKAKQGKYQCPSCQHTLVIKMDWKKFLISALIVIIINAIAIKPLFRLIEIDHSILTNIIFGLLMLFVYLSSIKTSEHQDK
jgi:DNA-directed RNA polymerase subunit RPC12/RpoP